MNVSFYKSDDDPRKLGKSMQSVVTGISCSVFGNCSLITPTILLAYNPAIINANYMYINDFNRWYFIADTSVDAGKKLYVHGVIDVLQTYTNEIKSCTSTCIRNGGIGRPSYVPDNSLPIYQSAENFTSLNIGELFNPSAINRNWLLTTK